VKRGLYWLEYACGVTGKWRRVTGACGDRGYVLGWYDASVSMYPCPPYRIVRSYNGLNGPVEIIEEHGGNKQPHTNHTNGGVS